MPCCGLQEYRVRVPWKYSLAGGLVFWSFALAVACGGVLLCWSRMGRGMIACLAAFLRALWRETMRETDSGPARWVCRASGRLMPISPALAAWVFHHREGVILGLGALLMGVFGGSVGLWLF